MSGEQPTTIRRETYAPDNPEMLALCPQHRESSTAVRSFAFHHPNNVWASTSGIGISPLLGFANLSLL
jgi:hypothetical protein